MNFLREAVIERILSLLRFPDNHWRSLILDDCEEIFLSLIDTAALSDINIYLDEKADICISARSGGKCKYNFRLNDLLMGIYPHQGHCFHLNGHSNATLPLVELYRMMKLNPECIYPNSLSDVRELAVEVQLSGHQSRGFAKCTTLILNRKDAPTLVKAKTYHSCVPFITNSPIYDKLRYLSVAEVSQILHSEVINLKNERDRMEKDLELGKIRYNTYKFKDVGYNLPKYHRKVEDIQFNIKTLEEILSRDNYTLKDKTIENYIKTFIERYKPDDYIKVGNCIETPERKIKTFLIFVVEGITPREIELTHKLMTIHNCKIIIGGNRILYHI